MTSSTLQVEGLSPANIVPPSPQAGYLSENEVRLLTSAATRIILEKTKNLHRLIEITSLIVAIAVAHFLTLAAGGLFFGIAAGLLVDTTLKSFYNIAKSRDLEFAMEALRTDSFKSYLQENRLNPSVPTLADMWRAYNRNNMARVQG